MFKFVDADVAPGKWISIFFYSNENNETIHVHVTKGSAQAKIWLMPDVSIHYAHGFSPAEQKTFLAIVKQHLETFKKMWYEHFE